ncbi:MAG: zinc-binding dehydrogenase [Gammaproteobacteria bacterium]|nr:zinc-binding dehydrogenase [Gammaproteobacteria bacterium]
MRAALMQRGKIWVDEVVTPQPGPGEVLVKSLACGICGSDLHAAQHTEAFVETSREAGGAFKLTTFEPVVLGHEFCAEVVEYGADTTRALKPGTAVCSIPVLSRQAGLPIGYSDEVHGGFAEYFLLSERFLLPVPQGTSAHTAAMTEPMAVGLHAVRRAGLGGHEAVLVLGCGPVGLAVVTNLKAIGVEPIIAADYSPGRRAFAELQGAALSVDPKSADPFDHPDLKKPENVVIFECVGVPGMLDHIYLGAPQNARIVVVGVCLQMDHARPLIAVNKELNVQYVLGYSVKEFKETLEHIADGSFSTEALITAKIGLDEVASAFDTLRSPDHHAKIVVQPGA